MWQSAEHEMNAIQRRVVGRHKRDVTSSDSDCGATLVVSRRERQGESRVTENECAELAARVSAGPEHTDRDLIHA